MLNSPVVTGRIKLLQKMLRIETLALVYSTVEYCYMVCDVAATTPASSTIKPVNNALRSVAGYLRPTPTENLPILAGIKPVDF